MTTRHHINPSTYVRMIFLAKKQRRKPVKLCPLNLMVVNHFNYPQDPKNQTKIIQQTKFSKTSGGKRRRFARQHMKNA